MRLWPRGPVGFRGKLFASYMSATVVLVVGLASFAQMQVAEKMERSAERRRQVVHEALEVESSVLAALAAQRGFLLTEDPSLLPHATGRVPAGVARKLARLLALTQDEPEWAALASRIVRAAEREIATIELTRQALQGGDVAGARLRAARAAPGTTALRTDVANLTAIVRAERDAQAREADLVARFAKWFIVAGNAVAFLLAATVTFWIGRAFADAQAAARELAARGQQLEEHARRLAAQEQVLAQRLTQERALTRRLERSNQALSRSNADLEQFAYVASHDLRAPLRGIASLGDWLEEDLGPALMPDTKKRLDTLRGRVQRLDALICGITTYSSAGRKEESIEQLDVGRLVREAVELSSPPQDARIELQPGFPTLGAPRAPLQQIFLNLLSNALKHGRPSDGSPVAIEVGWTEEPDAWSFSVTDHGPGIAPEHHQRIFGLFNRLSSRDKVEGAGIGLALVKKLVERHGGRVFVRSAPGQGATFGFTWPKETSVLMV